MNKYRAILFDPEDASRERPLQIFGNDWDKISRWAENAVARAVGKGAYVVIYQTTEAEIQRFYKPKEATS